LAHKKLLLLLMFTNVYTQRNQPVSVCEQCNLNVSVSMTWMPELFASGDSCDAMANKLKM